MGKSEFIEKQKKLYKSLQPCFCSALGETIYFTSRGLNHLLYKNRRPRNHNEQHYRMSLIPHLTTVIIGATKAIKTIKVKDPKEIITWTLQHKVRKKIFKSKIKVILIKEGAGKVEFLSVMERNHKKNLK